jgi:hypothetical protein
MGKMLKQNVSIFCLYSTTPAVHLELQIFSQIQNNWNSIRIIKEDDAWKSHEFENLVTLGLYARQPQKERGKSIFQQFFHDSTFNIDRRFFHLCIALITGLLLRVILWRARRTARGGRCTGARQRSRFFSPLLPTPSSKLLLVLYTRQLRMFCKLYS